MVMLVQHIVLSLPKGIRHYHPPLFKDGIHTASNSRLLAECMEAPPGFTDYLGTCVRNGQNQPISEQMVYDFR